MFLEEADFEWLDLPSGENFLEIAQELLFQWEEVFPVKVPAGELLVRSPADCVQLITKLLQSTLPKDTENNCSTGLVGLQLTGLFRADLVETRASTIALLDEISVVFPFGEVNVARLAEIGEGYVKYILTPYAKVLRLSNKWQENLQHPFIRANALRSVTLFKGSDNAGLTEDDVSNLKPRQILFIRLLAMLFSRYYAGERSIEVHRWNELLGLSWG